MRDSTLEAGQLDLNPSSSTYQLLILSNLSSLSITLLIYKMGINIAPRTQAIRVNLSGHRMLGGAH